MNIKQYTQIERTQKLRVQMIFILTYLSEKNER